MKKWILGFLLSFVVAFMVYNVTAATVYMNRLRSLEKDTIELAAEVESALNLARELEEIRLNLQSIEINLIQHGIQPAEYNLHTLYRDLVSLKEIVIAIDYAARLSNDHYEYYRERERYR